MARVFLLLGALLREVQREAEGFLAIGRNHFGAFTLLLLAVAPPASAGLQGLILVLVLPALGRDPLHLLPRDRLRLLPLAKGQRIVFQVTARLLNPVLAATLVLAWYLRWNPLWVLPWLWLMPPLLEVLLQRIRATKPRKSCLLIPGSFGPFYLQGL